MEIIKHKDDIISIVNFWSKEQCEAYINKGECIGYEAAKVSTERGFKVIESVRNNTRVIYKDFDLAVQLWDQLKDAVPKQLGNSVANGLNEMFRFYRYSPGQQFKKHRDQSYIRNEREASYYTFMIYLNDCFKGGETTFSDISIQPIQGSALIFLHQLEHSGSEVTEGTKYVLRTDIMYRLEI